MWIFHKFGLSLGVRVGGTMPRQWLSAHSNGRASWLNDYDIMSFCLSWSHMVHTGRHGRTGKEEKDIDHFSSNNENKTRQLLENRIPGKAPHPCLLPFHGWLFSVSSSAIDVGEHELETMGWGEAAFKLTHALNSWTVKPLQWIWLWWGTDRTPTQRPSYEPYLFLSEMCALSWSHTVPDRQPCLSLQCLVSLSSNLEKCPGVQLHNPKGIWKSAE